MKGVRLRKPNKQKQRIKFENEEGTPQIKLEKPPLRDDPKAFVDESYEWWLHNTESGRERLKKELEEEEAKYRNEI